MTEVGYDLTRSRAVLIGTAKYDHLPPIPAARHSLDRIRSLLTGDACGWPAGSVSVFADPRDPGSLPDQLMELFHAASDVALFYYVGHGQVDFQDTLCLGLVNSRTTAERRRTTSLPFDAVRYALTRSRAKVKIVILDCCYAGMAAQPVLSASDMSDRTRATGAYTVAAAGEFATAWFETDPAIRRPQTFFTKYLADIVEAGIPGEGPGLGLQAIFDEVVESLARDGMPEPTSRSADQVARFLFARNNAYEPPREAAIRQQAAPSVSLHEHLPPRQPENDGPGSTAAGNSDSGPGSAQRAPEKRPRAPEPPARSDSGKAIAGFPASGRPGRLTGWTLVPELLTLAVGIALIVGFGNKSNRGDDHAAATNAMWVLTGGALTAISFVVLCSTVAHLFIRRSPVHIEPNPGAPQSHTRWYEYVAVLLILGLLVMATERYTPLEALPLMAAACWLLSRSVVRRRVRVPYLVAVVAALAALPHLVGIFVMASSMGSAFDMMAGGSPFGAASDWPANGIYFLDGGVAVTVVGAIFCVFWLVASRRKPAAVLDDGERAALLVIVDVKWIDEEVRRVDRVPDDENWWVLSVRNSSSIPLQRVVAWAITPTKSQNIKFGAVAPGQRVWYILRPPEDFDLMGDVPAAGAQYTITNSTFEIHDGEVRKLTYL